MFRIFLKKLLNDKHGNIVVWQMPNLPLAVWAVSTIAAKIAQHGNPHQFFEVFAFGAIFTWAWLEIFQGASYFRRILGAAVLILTVYSRIN